MKFKEDFFLSVTFLVTYYLFMDGIQFAQLLQAIN